MASNGDNLQHDPPIFGSALLSNKNLTFSCYLLY